MKKFNFGHGVAVLYLSFAAMMGFFLVKALGEDWGLVTENYYAEENIRAERSSKMRATRNLAQPLVVRYESGERYIFVELPTDTEPQGGTLVLYRPSDASADRKFEVTGKRMQLPVEGMLPGLWRVQVEWEAEGVGYYDERPVIIGN